MGAERTMHSKVSGRRRGQVHGLTGLDGRLRSIALYIYRGEDESPEFVDEPGFEQLATFTIDMQPFHSLLQRCKTADGKDFLRADVSLAMRLSATELSAQCIFRHGGSLYRGPVTVTATHH